MRKSLRFLLISLAIAVPAAAQSYPRWTFYGGYARALQKPNSGEFIVSEGGETFSFQPCAADSADILGAHLQGVLCGRRDFHGIDTSVKYNLSRVWGIRTDISALYDKSRAVDTFGSGADAHTDTNVIKDRTLLAVTGIEVGDNAAARWRPFAHAMVGVARQRSIDTQTSTGPFDFQLRDTVTSLAMKVGGGIDLPVAPRVAVRLVEVDYTPVFAKSRHVPGNADFDQRVKGKTAQNVTFSFGIVVH
jgi:opacity protein-like surface antigen